MENINVGKFCSSGNLMREAGEDGICMGREYVGNCFDRAEDGTSHATLVAKNTYLTLGEEDMNTKIECS